MSIEPMMEPTTRTPPGRTRANIELIILGILVGLILKTSLDELFKDRVPAITDWHGFRATFLSFSLIQLTVFLAVLVRFIYGVYRFNEEAPEALERPVLVWNMFGILTLFISFYVAGLAITRAMPFYIAIAGAHLWDAIWLVGALALSNAMPPRLRKISQRFVAIDVTTIVMLMGAVWFVPNHFMGCASAIMVIISVVDFLWNHQFFFAPDSWAADTGAESKS